MAHHPVYKTSEENKYNRHAFPSEKVTKDRATETPFEYKERSTFNKEERRYSLLTKYQAETSDNSDKIFDDAPGKARRQCSMSMLNSYEKEKNTCETPPPVSHQTIFKKYLPVGLTSYRAESIQTQSPNVITARETDTKPREYRGKLKDDSKMIDNSERPLFLKDIKEKIYTSGIDGGFCILPGTLCTSNEPKIDVLTQQPENMDEELPRAILLDIETFSFLLKENFKVHFEQSAGKAQTDEESAIILSMILDSIGDAITIYTDRDEITSNEKELDKETDLIKEFLNTAGPAQVTDAEDKSDGIQDDLALRSKGIYVRKSKSDDERITQKPLKKNKKRIVSYACEVCQEMIDPVMCDLDSPHTCTEKCLVIKSLKVCCETCLHSRERGLTIHKCHNIIPEGVLEIRHMDNAGKICVCYLFWNRKKEYEDWRWQKNPFQDPTRVEFERETTLERDAILRVIFGPEGTMLKESLAETQLQLVCDSSNFPKRKTENKKPESFLSAVSSTELYALHRKRKSSDKKYMRPKLLRLNDSERRLLTKIGRFFDDIEKVGYGRGPPLVLKLRNHSALYDAYDLLTASSNIRLNYYRSLRVLFVSRYDYKMHPSTTNFQNENEVDELFQLFAQRLFVSPEKRLFIRPSEEAQCIYFNPHPNTHPQWFVLSGIVLALAILHQKKLDVRLPVCLFKCLLDRVLTIEDLKEIDPLAYQKLKWMKENDITTGQVKMTFTIKERIVGGVQEHELMVSGNQIAVTEKNKFRYIDLVVKWKLAERCLTQLNDFRRGFVSVIDPGFLTNFTEMELQSLIRNPPNPSLLQIDSRSSKFSEDLERRFTN